jgi:hypothetical protein
MTATQSFDTANNYYYFRQSKPVNGFDHTRWLVDILDPAPGAPHATVQILWPGHEFSGCRLRVHKSFIEEVARL